MGRGARIGRVRGEAFPETEYDSEYSMDLGNGHLLEPTAPFRFLNHSCEPNCELIIWEYPDPADNQIHVYTTQRLQAGTELTIDYAWPVEVAIPCLCGTPSCRGWIVAQDQVAQLPAAQTLLPQADSENKVSSPASPAA